MKINKESFVFYDSFFRTYDALKTTNPELAQEYIESVMEYGLSGEITSQSPIVQSLMVQTKEAIMRASVRHDLAKEAGAEGGKSQKNNDDIIWPLLDEGMSQVDIAKKTGLSTKTVYRSKVRKLKAEENNSAEAPIIQSVPTEFKF